MPRLKLNISAKKEQGSSEHLYDELQIDKVLECDLSAKRDGGREIDLDFEHEDVFELVFEDDYVHFISGEELERKCSNHPASRSAYAETGVLVLPHSFDDEAGTRGLGSGALKVLRKISSLGKQKLAEKLKISPAMAVGTIASLWENKHIPKPGLKNLCPGGKLIAEHDLETLGSLENTTIQASKNPVLILLHGTFSSTASSFGGFWSPSGFKAWNEKLSMYDGGVYALEHHSLVKSPLDNAIEILEALPPKQRVHLISHSRGGIVGELLSLPADCDLEFSAWKLFQDEKYEEQRGQLDKFQILLRKKAPVIERFVRVACPTRGTFLLNDRLDKYLEIVFNLLRLIPQLKFSPTLTFIKSLAIATLEQRTNPEALPGLEAMTPGSAIISLINSQHIETKADLSVVSGETVAKGLMKRLMIYSANLLAGEKNDLVVQSPSMLGGIKRSIPVRFFHDVNPEVTHFQYFSNDSSSSKILGALTARDDENMESIGYQVLQIEEDINAVGTRGWSDSDSLEHFDNRKPIIFLIPGIMGSHLKAEGDMLPIWLNYSKLLMGGITDLNIERELSASGIHNGSYEQFYNYLQGGAQVVRFPFDWRKSLQVEAKRLRELLEKALAIDSSGKQEVHVVAHSMGGLLMRMAIAGATELNDDKDAPTFWDRMVKEREGRFLMLGTPSRGAPAIARMLMGKDKMLKTISKLDIRNNDRDILKVVSRFQGVLEMLPAGSTSEINYFDRATWETFRKLDGDGGNKVMTIPLQSDLAKAAESRKLLDKKLPHPANILYVAGQAAVTSNSIVIKGNRLIEGVTHRGDERVPWDTGIPDEVKEAGNAWFMPGVGHGDLAAYKTTFKALWELLTKGRTFLTVLSKTEPGKDSTRGFSSVSRSGTGDSQIEDISGEEMQSDAGFEEDLPLFPNQYDFDKYILGMNPEREEQKAAITSIELRVLHGDLRFVKDQYIIVGHYGNEPILGSENALDKSLGWALSMRKRMGTFPGPENTLMLLERSRDFRNNGPAGAIVLGLGETGELTPGYLSYIIEQGLMNYAALAIDQANNKRCSLTNELTAVFMGTSALTLEESIVGFMRAVGNTNQKLISLGFADKFCFRRINFIEYFEDRAVEAAHLLRRILKNREFEELFKFDYKVNPGRDGKKRISYVSSAKKWEKIRILSPENDDKLYFDVYSKTARIGADVQPTNASLITNMLSESRRSHGSKEIGYALFELLFPNRIKDFLFNRSDLVLILDKDSARYPWELMIDRYTSGEPLSVLTAMIRQLRTEQYRQKPVISASNNALIVGNPDLQGWDMFSNLPAAEQEAIQVSNVMKSKGINVVESLGEMGSNIISKLFSHDYKILHLAGHGTVKYVDKNKKNKAKSPNPDCEEEVGLTGMVIGKNLILTPGDINQMRRVPELVFINCCHLGATDTGSEVRQYNELAANLGIQLIEMGVSAAVVAGWEVHDKDAFIFAQQFYEAMFRGESFGKAVQMARRKVYQVGSGDNTWGAYQCYGDPEYTLKGENRSSGDGDSFTYVSISEALIDLENLASSVKSAYTAKDVSYFLQKLENLIRNIKDHDWKDYASIKSSIADVYYEADRLAEAVAYYEEAFHMENADLPLRSTERWVNVKCRHVFEEYVNGRIKDEEASGKIMEVIETIGMLAAMAPTAERFALKASAHKRYALIRSGRPRLTQLKYMLEAYRSAEQIALAKAHQKDDPGSAEYATQNRISAEWFLLIYDQLDPTDGRRLLKELLYQIEKCREKNNNATIHRFWDKIEEADIRLLDFLARAELADESKFNTKKAISERQSEWEKIEEMYLGAKGIGSKVKMKSTTDQMQFIYTLLSERKKTKKENLKRLEDLKNKLKA